MRDPQASLHFEADKVVRRLKSPLPASHFLRSALARRWVEEGHLVPFEILDERAVTSSRYAFVTQPSEWCDAQLFEAGQLTLTLQQQAVAEGFDLKDASAWNVIFDGLRPVFCDLMSFVPLDSRKWWAAGQFARHFVLPLLVADRRGLRACEVFRVWRDGLPPEVGRRMLGGGRFLTRYWPLMAQGELAVEVTEAPFAHAAREEIERFRAGLHASLEWMLAGARPRKQAAASGSNAWGGYVEQRTHYAGESLDAKRLFVDDAMARIKPDWVLDLGCNTGEFSRLALANGARVVALDADHSSVQRLFREMPASSAVYPVVASLDDLSAGRGWGGDEHPGLPSRLAQQVDLVLMLALVHHLAVAASVPLNEVAMVAARWSRRWLIVEWIGEADPQLQMLCSQRQRSPEEFSITAQRSAFENAGWVVERESSLSPADRVIALMTLAA